MLLRAVPPPSGTSAGIASWRGASSSASVPLRPGHPSATAGTSRSPAAGCAASPHLRIHTLSSFWRPSASCRPCIRRFLLPLLLRAADDAEMSPSPEFLLAMIHGGHEGDSAEKGLGAPLPRARRATYSAPRPLLPPLRTVRTRLPARENGVLRVTTIPTKPQPLRK